MGVSRLITGPARLIRAAMRSPSAVLKALPSVLDYEFDQTSPIPLLSRTLATALGRYPVTLPSASELAPGNQSWVGLVHLICIAKALNARTIFEIGTYNGVTALTLARNLPSSIVHTLDLPPATIPHLAVSASDPSNFSTFARRAYEGSPEEERIVQHLGDSATFDFSPFFKTCQLVYVDGAHSFAYVANDTAIAFELLGESGAVTWDDYWRRVPDVGKFLDGLGRSNLFRLPESRLVVWFSESAAAKLTGNS